MTKFLILLYAAGVFVTFAVVSATSAEVCNLRAHDPMRCRVKTALPAATFWPLTIAYGIGEAVLVMRED